MICLPWLWAEKHGNRPHAKIENKDAILKLEAFAVLHGYNDWRDYTKTFRVYANNAEAKKSGKSGKSWEKKSLQLILEQQCIKEYGDSQVKLNPGFCDLILKKARHCYQGIDRKTIKGKLGQQLRGLESHDHLTEREVQECSEKKELLDKQANLEEETIAC